MSRCRIVSYAVPDGTGRFPPGGAVRTVSQCETHGMSLDSPRQGAVCPIGKIEDATENAIKSIDAAAARVLERTR